MRIKQTRLYEEKLISEMQSSGSLAPSYYKRTHDQEIPLYFRAHIAGHMSCCTYYNSLHWINASLITMKKVWKLSLKIIWLWVVKRCLWELWHSATTPTNLTPSSVTNHKLLYRSRLQSGGSRYNQEGTASEADAVDGARWWCNVRIHWLREGRG